MMGPRHGAAGLWDRMIGPGATTAEGLLTVCWALACGAAVVGYALVAHLGWSTVQLAVVTLLALDIGGGVSANASNSAKRWFHRPGQGARHHLLFVFAHVHPFVLALAFPPFGWVGAAVVYSYLLAASLSVVFVPLYLKRPVAFVVYCGGLLISLYAVSPPAGLEWFAPFFFLKLLVAHLLPEEAYRPTKGEA